MDAERARALRALPSIDALLSNDEIVSAAGGVANTIAIAVARRHQEDARARILDGDVGAGQQLAAAVAGELSALTRPAFPTVINGTGVIVQTNLGRAPVSDEAADAMRNAASNYLSLETDLESGERGGRGRSVEAMLVALTGAERALVVNNNAAAVLLALSALASGGDVLVSRGEAIEIGGGVRIPEILMQSGAALTEVGTTNRTYVRDYESAISERTRAVLRVHASNFAIVGFTARPSAREITDVARRHSVIAIEDVGSGCLIDTSIYGLDREPTLSESVDAGFDVVCASGDKLLGGPQAGILLGKAATIERLRRHPLARAVRADKTCLAGLGATLQHYLRGDAAQKIPVWWSISREPAWLEQRVRRWVDAINTKDCVVTNSTAVVGGGSLPGMTLDSFALALNPGVRGSQSLAKTLRTGDPAVVPHIVQDRIFIDARTVLPAQDQMLIDAVRIVLADYT